MFSKLIYGHSPKNSARNPTWTSYVATVLHSAPCFCLDVAKRIYYLAPHGTRGTTPCFVRLPGRLLPRPMHAVVLYAAAAAAAAPRQTAKFGILPAAKRNRRPGPVASRFARSPRPVGVVAHTPTPWAQLVTHACRHHGHGHAYPFADYSPITSRKGGPKRKSYSHW